MKRIIAAILFLNVVNTLKSHKITRSDLITICTLEPNEIKEISFRGVRKINGINYTLKLEEGLALSKRHYKDILYVNFCNEEKKQIGTFILTPEKKDESSSSSCSPICDINDVESSISSSETPKINISENNDNIIASFDSEQILQINFSNKIHINGINYILKMEEGKGNRSDNDALYINFWNWQRSEKNAHIATIILVPAPSLSSSSSSSSRDLKK